MRYFILFLTLLIAGSTWSQSTVRLEDCYRWAQEHHPIQQRKALLDMQHQLALSQLDKSRLPSLFWNTEAGLQSESVKVPFSIPGTEKIELPLVNVRSTLDLNYTIYDGGMKEIQRKLENASQATQQQSIVVELNRIKSSINELVMGIRLLRARDALLANTQENLQSRLTSLEAGEKHGVVLPSEVEKVRVESYKLDAQHEEITGQIRGLIATLNALTGQNFAETAEWEIPNLSSPTFAEAVRRPELELFALQRQQILANTEMTEIQNKPKLSTYARAGLGYPNPLNFFDTDLSPFGQIGIRLNWKILDWKQAQIQRESLSVQAQLVDNQKEVFLYNLNLIDGKYREDWNRIQRLIENDKRIVALQAEILTQVTAQLDHGVIMVTDYLSQVSAELDARLNLSLHELQLQQLTLDYLTQKGWL
ncbi:MAG: hypothetical protein DHS20C18_23900 [Saprospiraceae bacterium]|nr:MAG: hypothetical protein DHS20C18_23900 [Saprospiraceae bacterium]